MKSSWFGVVVGAAGALAAGLASACPSGTNVFIQNTGLSVSTSTAFDPFGGTGVRKGTTIIIDNSSGVDCTNISLKFEDLTSAGLLTASGSSDQIPFKITPAAGSAQLINDASGIFIGTIPASTTSSIDIDFVIDPATSVAGPGNPYLDSDITLLLTSTDAAQPLDQSRQLAVSTSVDTLLDINIGGATYMPGSLSAYTMDLGTLAAGVSRSVNLTVRANVAHEVTISSAMNGVMVGPVPGSIETHDVPYTVTIGGSTFGLGTPVTLPLSGSKTGLSGSIQSLEVQITSADSARAGAYEDVVSLTLAGSL